MIVISDTTPLITLLKINRLDLLEKLYGEVKIPRSVYNELTTNPFFTEEADKIKKCPFLKVEEVKNSKNVELLQKATGLDLGESEALVLCKELNSDLLLMDEAHGRFVAKQLGLTITGAIGILVYSYKTGILSEQNIRDYVEILKSSGRFLSKELLQGLLDMVKN